MKKLIFSLLCLPALGVAAEPESVRIAREGCQKLVADFAKHNEDPENIRRGTLITFGTAMVPTAHEDPAKGSLPVFWWKRAGVDAQHVPLVYVHGGVAGDSWRGFRDLKNVLSNYPGDYVSFDLRGEGCSKQIASNLPAGNYAAYRLGPTSRDLEWLRQKVFGYPKWRMFGQSRGAAVILAYLDSVSDEPNYPVESVFLHGNLVSPAPDDTNSYLIRQIGFYSTSLEYLRLFPGDDTRVAKIRATLSATDCLEGMDGIRLCGPDLIDLLSIYFTNKARWASLHELISSMAPSGEPDHAAIMKVMAGQTRVGYLPFTAYVLGTNHLDMASMPDPRERARLIAHESYNAFLSETRVILNVVYPALASRGVAVPAAGTHPIDYDRVARGLARQSTTLTSFYSRFDPIGNATVAKLNHSRLRGLGSLYREVSLANSSHEGWLTEAAVSEALLKGAP